MKPQWSGTPTVCKHLAVDGHGPDALGHHRHRLDVAAVRAHLDALAGGDADFLGEHLADLDELLGLDDRVQARMRGPVMEMLGEAIRGRDVRKLRRPCRRPPDRPGTRAPPDCWSPAAGADSRGCSRAAFRTARSARGTAPRPWPRARTSAPTPSGFMMNGSMPPAGFSPTGKSGTSAPPHALPFQAISLRFGFQGLPAGSQDARLYEIRAGWRATTRPS